MAFCLRAGPISTLLVEHRIWSGYNSLKMRGNPRKETDAERGGRDKILHIHSVEYLELFELHTCGADAKQLSKAKEPSRDFSGCLHWKDGV